MATSEEVAARRDRIAEEILKGGWTSALRRRMAKEYGVSEPTIKKDYDAIREMLREDFEANDIRDFRARWHQRSEMALGVMWETIEGIRHDPGGYTSDGKPCGSRESMSGAVRTYTGLLKTQAEVLGLDAPQRVEVTGKDGGAVELRNLATEEDLKAALEELRREIGQD